MAEQKADSNDISDAREMTGQIVVEKKTCGDFKESQQAETLDLKMLQAEAKEKSEKAVTGTVPLAWRPRGAKMTDNALCGSEETDIKSELSEAEALDLEELKPHHRAEQQNNEDEVSSFSTWLVNVAVYLLRKIHIINPVPIELHGQQSKLVELGIGNQNQRMCVSKQIYVCSDRDACLYSHNKARDIHGHPMLMWDSQLAEKAKNWAIYLIENECFDHQHDSSCGENLYEITYSQKSHRVYDAVFEQYKEIEDYDFNNPERYEEDCPEFCNIGHFSQIVWKETTKVGCCVAFDKDSRRTVTVTKFSPGQGYAFTEQVPHTRPAKIPSSVEDFISCYDVTPTMKRVDDYMR